MDHRTRDILGRLCRWLLLAIAAGSGAGALWVGSAARASIPTQLSPQLCVPDVIARPGLHAVMVCNIEPLPHTVYGYLMMSGLKGRARSLALMDGKDFRIRLSQPSPGVHPYEVGGVPYGGFSFLRAGGNFVVVPADRPIFIIDASLADREANRPAWPHAVQAIGQAGQLTFLHPGPVPQFEEFRNRLRKSGVDAPVLSAYDIIGGMDRSLSYLAEATNAPGAAPVAFITEDAWLARKVDRSGFSVHLIGDGTPSRRIAVHKSFDAFVAHLGRASTQPEADAK